MVIKFKKNKKGVALVTVLLVFAVITIISATTLMISVSQAKQTQVSVNYNQAYYLARSSVEIVAKDLTDRINALNQMKTNIDSFNNKTGTDADLTALNNLITQYNTAKNFIDNNIIGHTINLTNTNGYAAPSVKVYSKSISGYNYIYIEASMTVGNATATAKANLSSIVNNNEAINLTTSTTTNTNTNVIYGWGNVNIGTNAQLSSGSTIGYSGTYTSGTTLPNQKVTSFPITTMKPPASIWPKTAMTLPSGGKFTSSGYYGKVVYSSSDNINWSIDTSYGDVSLVFDSISITNDFTITVTGANRLYIYLVQNDTGQKLINAQNKFDIVGTNGRIPLTHIISYDKNMQNGTYSDPATTIYIKNSATLDAFFYTPYSDVLIDNNSNIIGSIFAKDITINNNMSLELQKSSDPNFGSNVVSTTTTSQVNSVPLNYYNFSGNKTWVK